MLKDLCIGNLVNVLIYTKIKILTISNDMSFSVTNDKMKTLSGFF